MQLTTILALAPFLGAVVAVPSRAHDKFHHKKRDITWFTVTSEVIETVYETTTVWVAPGQAAPSAAPSPASPSVPAVASPSPPAASPSPPAAASSSGLVGLQSPSPSPQSPSPVASPSPAPASPSPAPASPSPAPVESPSPAQPSQPAAQPSQPSGGSGGGAFPVATQPGASQPDGPCTPDQKCTGEATYYSVGLGACGTTSSDGEMVVALPVAIMGTASSGGSPNPLCGRNVMIQLTPGGPQVKASVVDKCMGCKTPYDLDMSTGLFAALGGVQSVGRYTEMTWYWTQ